MSHLRLVVGSMTCGRWVREVTRWLRDFPVSRSWSKAHALPCGRLPPVAVGAGRLLNAAT